MRIPLHLDPSDQSQEAALKRVQLHTAMAMINPRGFRSPSKRSTPSRIEKIASKAFA